MNPSSNSCLSVRITCDVFIYCEYDLIKACEDLSGRDVFVPVLQLFNLVHCFHKWRDAMVQK